MKYRVRANEEGLKELQIKITEKGLKSLIAKSDARIDDENYSTDQHLIALSWSIIAGAMLDLIEKNGGEGENENN